MRRGPMDDRGPRGVVDEFKEFVRDVVHGVVTRIAVVAALLVLAVVGVIALTIVLVAG